MPGQPMPQGRPEMAYRTMPQAQSSSRAIWWVLGALVLLLGGVFILAKAGIINIPGITPLVAKAENGPALTRTPIHNPGFVQKPVHTQIVTGAPPPPAKMPQDVLDWLKHLQQTEQRRMDLSQDNIATAMVDMSTASMGGAMEILQSMASGDDKDPPPPTDKLKKDAEDMRGQWQDLVTFFESKPPPPECVPIRDQYDQAVRDTSGMILDIMDALTESANDPKDAIKRLNESKGKSKESIDFHANKTDDLVQQLCTKYSVEKWFKIVGDVGGGGLGF